MFIQTDKDSVRPARSQSGTSLVELLIVCLIITIISAGIIGLLTANATVSRNISNKVDTIDEARVMLARLGKDMRMGRTIGEVYGIAQGQYAKQFPAASDPMWSQQGMPPGWTGAWPAQLSSSCMIIQIPMFDSYTDASGGWPLALPAGFGNPPTTSAIDDVETHIYKMIADPDTVNHPGEYRMELWKFPGRDVNGVIGPISGPQIVLKNIVGPTLAGASGLDNLCIFQVVDKTQPNSAPFDPGSNAVTSAALANYTGLIVNLDLNNHDATHRSAFQNSGRLAFKTEIFMRNNILSTTTSP